MPSPWLDATDKESIDHLEGIIREREIKITVIDNLGVILGDADENSPQMSKVMANLRRLAEGTGAVLNIIHHQRKQNGSTATGESLRGHSSINQGIDLALLVERDAQSSTVSVRSTKTRDVDVLPFGADFSFTPKMDADGWKTNELETARFWGVPVDDTLSDYAIETEILEVLSHEKELNQSNLKKFVKESLPDIREHRISNMAKKMAAEGKLLENDGNRGALLYTLI